MLETILVLVGLFLGSGQQYTEYESESQYYYGLSAGCAGATIVLLGQQGVDVPNEQVITFCTEITLSAQEANLYGKQR